MAGEIQFITDPSVYVGSSLIAKVYDETGTQQGVDVPLVDANNIAYFVGDMPSGVPAGDYMIRVFDILGVIETTVGHGCICWTGTEEIEDAKGYPAVQSC